MLLRKLENTRPLLHILLARRLELAIWPSEGLAFLSVCRITRLGKTPDSIIEQRAVTRGTPGAQATSSISFGVLECRETQWCALIGVEVLYRVDKSTHDPLYRISEERKGKVGKVDDVYLPVLHRPCHQYTHTHNSLTPGG